MLNEPFHFVKNLFHNHVRYYEPFNGNVHSRQIRIVASIFKVIVIFVKILCLLGNVNHIHEKKTCMTNYVYMFTIHAM